MEIHNIPPRLVPPVACREAREPRLQLLQDQMLPEQPQIVRPQRIPTARVTHKPRVEGIHLRLLHQSMPAAALAPHILEHVKAEFESHPQ